MIFKFKHHTILKRLINPQCTFHKLDHRSVHILYGSAFNIGILVYMFQIKNLWIKTHGDGLPINNLQLLSYSPNELIIDRRYVIE